MEKVDGVRVLFPVATCGIATKTIPLQPKTQIWNWVDFDSFYAATSKNAINKADNLPMPSELVSTAP